jgi:hypothetical protein
LTVAALFVCLTLHEDRALAYLAREVPAWHSENRCFSCHNNGDGARALYAALRLGWQVPEAALRDTSEWLASPSQWEGNRGDPRFSDKKLARLQFAAALAEAIEARALHDRAFLRQAAQLLAQDQRPDGAWQVEGEALVGSPVTYGAVLATALAKRVLELAGDGFRERADRAGTWLRAAPLRSVVDAAAVLMGVRDSQRQQDCLQFIRRAQASDGGWGPVAHSPPEPFDTAVVLLALNTLERTPDTGALIDRGRAWLLRAQLSHGGWTETTRPAGGQSYAQHISTAGWATLALLETAKRAR